MDTLDHIIQRAVVETVEAFNRQSIKIDPEHIAYYIADKVHDKLLETPEIEWRHTEGQRKAWDGLPDLSDEGWIPWRWRRLDFTEEILWLRVTPAPPAFPPPTMFVAFQESTKNQEECPDCHPGIRCKEHVLP